MFNLENFDIKLSTEFIGRNFIYTEEIESTNSFLLGKSVKGINGTVLLAEKQTRGRGRKDRVWYSAKGQNLTFSILITEKKYLTEKINMLNFISSLSVAQAIENLFQLRTELKWPNDILINGKKTAGILLESSSQGSKIEKLVIGIGINVNQGLFQGNFNSEPTSLKLELNHSIDRERLLAEVLNIFEENYLEIPNNSKQLLDDWRERCRMIGEKISVTDSETTRYGIFDDIDENGFLLLKNKNTIEKIHFGDVSIS